MRAEVGQGTIEWTALVLAAALGLATLAQLGGRLDPRELGDALVEAVGCAIGGRCAPPLERVYGREVARLVREHAPNIVYERRSAQLPVDFRRCRTVACANGSDRPARIARTDLGLPVTAFTHVVDRRRRGGSLYLQYWLYFPESFTAGVGRRLGPLSDHWPGFHPDDWEGYQIKIPPPGSGGGRPMVRASAHGGYEGSRGASAWTPETGWYRVSGGSHAGQIVGGPTGERTTPANDVELVPLESLASADLHRFEVAPPWAKAVYSDPESADS